MAEGYDGFNVAMGLMADTFDEADARRKEARDEQTAIRREDRANVRADAVTKSTRDYNREVLIDNRAYEKTVLENKRTYDEQLAEDNLEKVRLLTVKDDLAKRGLPYQGLIDVREGMETIARYDANKPMGDWFIINKDYIDKATINSPELVQGILSPGPLNVEELRTLPPDKLLEVKSRLEAPVNTIKQTAGRQRLMNTDKYKQGLKAINRGMASIGGMWNRFMGPGMAQYETNAPGSKAAHLAVIGVLNQSEEYEDLLTPAQRDTFMRNPHAFLSNIYNQDRRGLGQRNLTIEEGAKLGDLWATARSQALGELKSEGSGPGQLGTADKKAAIEFLTRELEQKDMASAREQYIKAFPQLLGLFDSYFNDKVYGDLWRENTMNMLDVTSKQQPVTPQGRGQGTGQPGLPGLPGLPGQPAATTGQPAALGGKPPIPPAKAVPTAGQSVEVKGGLPSEVKQSLAEKYYTRSLFGQEGTGDYLGYWASPGNLPPGELVKRGTLSAEALKKEKQDELRMIGASRTASGIMLKPDRSVLRTTAEAGEPTLVRVREPWSRNELKANKETAIKLFREMDEIDADLKQMKAQAERQTGIKIPSLGSGSRQ